MACLITSKINGSSFILSAICMNTHCNPRRELSMKTHSKFRCGRHWLKLVSAYRMSLQANFLLNPMKTVFPLTTKTKVDSGCSETLSHLGLLVGSLCRFHFHNVFIIPPPPLCSLSFPLLLSCLQTGWKWNGQQLKCNKMFTKFVKMWVCCLWKSTDQAMSQIQPLLQWR